MDLDRGFSAGSRQAPDPHDQYLEGENYYRKHTPRDPSSLFRCISEQLFDTQNYFRRVREECCAYMLRYKDYFESHVDGDFDEYMQNMQHYRTRGTLLELRALAYRYRHNVILFEPYTLGNSFIQQPQYAGATFMVFVAPDYHFDTVYTREEIEDAAFSQSLVYDVLYKQVFQLPDVSYAVERMLHDQLGERLTDIEEGAFDRTDPESDYEEESALVLYDDGDAENKSRKKQNSVGCVSQDGRQFIFDGKDNTKCILEDYRMCRFHNDSFDDYLDSQRAAGDHNNNNNNNNCQSASNNGNFGRIQKRREDSMLKESDISCVRQLLNSGITPFPYKVAKALDPLIYRNIEFDVWSEMRKLSRSKYMSRRYISVGDKCFIRLNEAKEAIPLMLPQSNKKALGHSKRVGGVDENQHGDENKNHYSTNGGGAQGKVYVGHVQHIEKFTNTYHVYVVELGERLMVNGNTLRSCLGANDSRDFTVIGLNGGGAAGRDSSGPPFRNYDRIRGPYNRYSPQRPGFANGSPTTANFGPRGYMRNSNSGYSRNGIQTFCPRNVNNNQYSYNNRSNFMNNNNNKRFAQQNNIHSANSDDEDMLMLKKKAAQQLASESYHEEYTDSESKLVSMDIYGEGGGDLMNDHKVNLKDLLCSTYYYAESAKYFQSTDIIAMPAFITTAKPNNEEQRHNKENLKRNQNEGNGNKSPVKIVGGDLLGNSKETEEEAPPHPLPLDGATRNEVAPLTVAVDTDEPEEIRKLIDDEDQSQQAQQMPYEQQQQQFHAVTGSTDAAASDPNNLFFAGQQQYYASGAPGAYYMPAMDLNGAYYAGAPCYRNAGSVVTQPNPAASATTPYYFNYVCGSNGTQYLLANGSATGYATTTTALPQFDTQVIPIQTAIRRRDLLCSDAQINTNPSPSYSVKGNDLPSECNFIYQLSKIDIYDRNSIICIFPSQQTTCPPSVSTTIWVFSALNTSPPCRALKMPCKICNSGKCVTVTNFRLMALQLLCQTTEPR